MNDTPDSAFAIFLKDGTDFVLLGKITSYSVDLCAFFVSSRGISRESLSCKLFHTVKTLGVRVVVVVDRDDFVTTGLLQAIDDVRTCQASNMNERICI